MGIEGVKAAREEAMKFCYEEGAKAGAAAARKKRAANEKAFGEEGQKIGEDEGGKAGAEAGAKAGGDAAGEEGAKIGREIGAEMAKAAAIKVGKRVGKQAGLEAGKKAGKQTGWQLAKEAAREISRDKVAALRKMFGEKTAAAGAEAGATAGRKAALEAIQGMAIEIAAKNARDKILAMASRGEIKLSSSWKPTALIAVMNGRKDLSDMDKIKLAAKAKMAGNLGDLLPKKMSAATSGRLSHEDTMSLNLSFKSDEKASVEEEVDQTAKWSTVVFSDLPDEKKKEQKTSTKDNVNSLKKRFETSNMKNNEAYVIM